jgi:hypothetical protein
MLYPVIEHFYDGAAPDIYRRTRKKRPYAPRWLGIRRKLGRAGFQDLLSTDAHRRSYSLREVERELERSQRVRDRASTHGDGSTRGSRCAAADRLRPPAAEDSDQPGS